MKINGPHCRHAHSSRGNAYDLYSGDTFSNLGRVYPSLKRSCFPQFTQKKNQDSTCIRS